MSDREPSLRYLDELDEVRRLVEELVMDGWPVARIVIRARSLYRKARRTERVRYRESEAIRD